MREMTYREFRENLADTLNRIEYQGETVIITRRGKAVAQIGPIKEPTVITLYETNSDLLIVGRGDRAWNFGAATADMEGKFAEDARTWVGGDWEPGEVNGQTPTHIDDDLTAVAEWSPETGLRLLVDAERIGGAAKVYLACECAVCGNRPVDLPGESFREWGEDPETEEPRWLCGTCWERYGTRADGTPAS